MWSTFFVTDEEGHVVNPAAPMAAAGPAGGPAQGAGGLANLMSGRSTFGGNKRRRATSTGNAMSEAQEGKVRITVWPENFSLFGRSDVTPSETLPTYTSACLIYCFLCCDLWTDFVRQTIQIQRSSSCRLNPRREKRPEDSDEITANRKSRP